MIKKHIYFSLLYVLFGFTYAHAEELHPAVAFYNTLSETEKQRCINKVVFNKGYQKALYEKLYRGIQEDIDSNTKIEDELTSITADHITTLCQNDLGRTIEALIQRAEKKKPVIVYFWQTNRENDPVQTLGIEPSKLLDKLNIDVGIMITNHDYTIDQWATRDSEKDVCKVDGIDKEYSHNTNKSINQYTILNESIDHSIEQNESLKLPDGYQPYNGFFPRDANWFSPLIRYECCKDDVSNKTYPWHSTDILAFTKAAHALANSYKQQKPNGTMTLELQQVRGCEYKAYVVAINANCDSKTVNRDLRTTYYDYQNLGRYTALTTNCVKVLYGPIKLTE